MAPSPNGELVAGQRVLCLQPIARPFLSRTAQTRIGTVGERGTPRSRALLSGVAYVAGFASSLKPRGEDVSFSNNAKIELTRQSRVLEERLLPITAEMNAYPLRVNKKTWETNLQA